MGIKINGLSIEDYEPFDTKVVAIDVWYDRHGRDYCIELLNKDGFQVGDAIYVGNKADKNQIVKELKAQYGIVAAQKSM